MQICRARNKLRPRPRDENESGQNIDPSVCLYADVPEWSNGSG